LFLFPRCEGGLQGLGHLLVGARRKRRHLRRNICNIDRIVCYSYVFIRRRSLPTGSVGRRGCGSGGVRESSRRRASRGSSPGSSPGSSRGRGMGGGSEAERSKGRPRRFLLGDERREIFEPPERDAKGLRRRSGDGGVRV
jgi:hypothetical protein